MDRRLFWLCLMTVLGSVTSQDKPVPTPPPSGPYIDKSSNTLMCSSGDFEQTPLKTYEASGLYTCCPSEDNCLKARVKILHAENLIQLDKSALITVVVSNVLVTALIGWAVYIVCAEPSTRTSYQDNKASDRKSLIPNERVSNNTSGETTYQRLNTRPDEYSTLGARKQKNPKHPISP
ncbi:hypothetical protein PO909_003801 [Leuciscus waleckii]